MAPVRWLVVGHERAYDASGKLEDQWEMYHRRHRPVRDQEPRRPRYVRTRLQQAEYVRLRRKLSEVEQTRLQPLPNTPESPIMQRG